MTITYHRDLIQGSDEWLAIKRGIISAGSMNLLMTPTLKPANNDKTRSHIYELAAQRITNYTEPQFFNDHMLRGQIDEVEARALYAQRFAPVEEVGFITNDAAGFLLGYSPDGVVGADGLIECKSRLQKHQIETLVTAVRYQEVPAEYVLQIQTGLLVTGRSWCDFISYCGGLPMAVIRCFPDQKIQDAILEAASDAEKRIEAIVNEYEAAIASDARLIPTERKIVQEMHL